MLQHVKDRLVGQTITDVGLVNVGGIKHARLMLSDSRTPLLVAWDNVLEITTVRKPMQRATVELTRAA